MKIPNRQELQQIAFNNSSDIHFKDKKCTAKSAKFFFLIYLSDRTSKLNMAIYDKVRDEKLQCNNNREAAKISTLIIWKN